MLNYIYGFLSSRKLRINGRDNVQDGRNSLPKLPLAENNAPVWLPSDVPCAWGRQTPCLCCPGQPICHTH